ncbi:coproporphyrinogen III oxidase [Nitritalea halalkaliphila LW7]|uniref:Coproporphyrinogen III oxidase n=1 Tax=Nitritalea halalkaliphila LW7 TaxID=1189621 RepID=I5C457_9BACT|nr:coproporphyrinogen III oxidase [Nitritalea halalkaliphila]EIM76609.1 coproporphyrinogen III oxidase [Nitritalea halalkaliphila LW7]
MENATLIQKYNVPAPRYTSYPPVPQWEQMPDRTEWQILLRQAYAEFGEEEGIHLYIHLPYCESLCTYCGCTKRITKNHQVEEPYVYSVLKEWEEHLAALPPKPLISGIHLGGGTPTFFSPEHLELLLSELLDGGTLAADAS